jgi:hypothetical protein
MNDRFDELAKGLAQSVTRRGALKKFGAGLAGIALAAPGVADRAKADEQVVCDCSYPCLGCKSCHGGCYRKCLISCSG